MQLTTLLAAPVLLILSLAGCGNGTVEAGREPGTSQRALAAVRTAAEHRAVERGGTPLLYHEGWTRRITAVDRSGGERELLRVEPRARGTTPGEAVLGFRDVALSLFDPAHRVRAVTVRTLDGEAWTFEAREHAGAAPARDPAPMERARSSVQTGAVHRVMRVRAAGDRIAIYHPGWSSRIRAVDATGRTHDVYRQTRVFHGAYPREVAIGFDDVGIAVFDANHRIAAVNVETVAGESWTFDEVSVRCPVDCPPSDSVEQQS
ncbi:MAG TPA: hypothetical protein VLK84_29450 [Longimicrobium sp.]|nr:hypothetical protein [Longimicrobium sp.]